MPVPKLRFRDEQGQNYPDWQNIFLGDIFIPINHFTSLDDRNKLYSLTVENGITPKTERYDRSFLVKKNDKFKIVHKNEFVYNPMNMTIGAVGYNNLDKDIVVSGYYVVMRSNSINTDQFWYNWLKSYNAIRLFKRKATGSLTEKQRIQFSTFEKIKADIPSFPEQEKIADFLTSYDRMIDVQSQRVEAMKNRKKGLLQKIFSQEIRFKDEQGQDYPEWKKAQFCDLFSSLRKNSLSRDALNYECGTLRNIHYGDILVKFHATIKSMDSNIPYVNSNKIPKTYDVLKAGDIIIADTAEDETAGKGVELIEDSIPTISGLHTLPYRPKINFACGYLGYFLNSTIYHKQLLPLLHGIKVLSLTKSELEKTMITYPSLPEQQKIADFLTVVDTQIEVEEKRLETMKTIKKGLLQQMFI